MRFVKLTSTEQGKPPIFVNLDGVVYIVRKGTGSQLSLAEGGGTIYVRETPTEILVQAAR